MENQDHILVRPYTIKELAKIYQVSIPTMRKWINELKNEIGEKKGWFYSIRQVKIIFDNLCVPYTTELDK